MKKLKDILEGLSQNKKIEDGDIQAINKAVDLIKSKAIKEIQADYEKVQADYEKVQADLNVFKEQEAKKELENDFIEAGGQKDKFAEFLDAGGNKENISTKMENNYWKTKNFTQDISNQNQQQDEAQKDNSINNDESLIIQ